MGIPKRLWPDPWDRATNTVTGQRGSARQARLISSRYQLM